MFQTIIQQENQRMCSLYHEAPANREMWSEVMVEENILFEAMDEMDELGDNSTPACSCLQVVSNMSQEETFLLIL